jgi:hypothetical protein
MVTLRVSHATQPPAGQQPMAQMNRFMRTRRILLLAFLASLCTIGLFGIMALIRGTTRLVQDYILLTTVLACAASILGLASTYLRKRRRWHPIGLLGILASPAALLTTVPIFFLRLRGYWELLFEQITGTLWVIAVALPYIGLLSFAKLHKRYEWIRVVTIGSIALLATLVIYLIIAQLPYHEFENLMRGVGIFAIVAVCGTLAVLVFHYISHISRRESQRTTDLQVEITCPRCTTRQTLQAGRSQCVNCRLRFLIEIEEEQCPKCAYPCYLLASPVCPECGTTLNTIGAVTESK